MLRHAETRKYKLCIGKNLFSLPHTQNPVVVTLGYSSLSSNYLQSNSDSIFYGKCLIDIFQGQLLYAIEMNNSTASHENSYHLSNKISIIELCSKIDETIA